MRRHPFRRLTSAFLVVLSLLFSQLALASYVCPAGSATEQPPAVMHMAPGEPCEGMASDEDRQVLCHQHCADAPQSFDAVKLPALSLPAIVQVLIVPVILDVAEHRAAASAADAAAQPPSEPLFLSTLRLRV